jgi:hypothetical protein
MEKRWRLCAPPAPSSNAMAPRGHARAQRRRMSADRGGRGIGSHHRDAHYRLRVSSSGAHLQMRLLHTRAMSVRAFRTLRVGKGMQVCTAALCIAVCALLAERRHSVSRVPAARLPRHPLRCAPSASSVQACTRVRPRFAVSCAAAGIARAPRMSRAWQPAGSQAARAETCKTCAWHATAHQRCGTFFSAVRSPVVRADEAGAQRWQQPLVHERRARAVSAATQHLQVCVVRQRVHQRAQASVIQAAPAYV